MSFKCKKCGPVKLRNKQYRVVTEVRDVTYLIQIKTLISGGRDEIKTIKKTYGKEIVAEDVYCSNCVPKTVLPKVVEKVERKNIVDIRRPRQGSY